MGKNLGTQKSIRFSDEELAELDLATKKHKTIKAAVMAGIRMVNGQNKTDWPSELRRLAKELDGKR